MTSLFHCKWDCRIYTILMISSPKPFLNLLQFLHKEADRNGISSSHQPLFLKVPRNSSFHFFTKNTTELCVFYHIHRKRLSQNQDIFIIVKTEAFQINILFTHIELYFYPNQKPTSKTQQKPQLQTRFLKESGHSAHTECKILCYM